MRAAGDKAKHHCERLANFTSSHYNLSTTFAQYYPEGSNPSLELLALSYPDGVLPQRPSIKSLLKGVGPDFDLSVDDYGRNRGPTAKNGPLGGLPAFCRFGSFIQTSELTQVLAEVWLPLKPNSSIPLVQPNVTAAEYPTSNTPIELDEEGGYLKGPPYLMNSSSASSTGGAPMDLRQEPRTSRNAVRSKSKSKSLSGEHVLGKGHGWNERLLYIENGGLRGAVPFTDMKQIMARYSFAVVGSNKGHWSTTGGATWVNGTQYNDTLKDWGGRATHVSQKLASEVVHEFYGIKPHRKYHAGCSNGGKGALEQAMYHPFDFDGILAGSPGINFNHMNAGQIHLQKRHRAKSVGADAVFTDVKLQGAIHQTILDQCDGLDGVDDRVITDPRKCKPDFTSTLLCGGPGEFGASNLTCLTAAQISNLEELYKPTYIDGHYIYPAYALGSESKASTITGKAAKAGNWFDLVVRKSPNLTDNGNWSYWNNLTSDVVFRGDREGTDWTATKTDLSAALSHAKIITYHGLSDFTISPYNTYQYVSDVKKATKGKLSGGKRFEDVFRFYPIPGMNHCRDGDGPWHFGGVTQNDAGNRPYRYDTAHDMLLSLVAWVEQGHREPYQIGAHYASRAKVIPSDPMSASDSSDSTPPEDVLPTVYESYNYGLKHTRKLCPWPKEAVYKGGSAKGEDAYRSFQCE